MTFITSDGTVVGDDDPRARAARGRRGQPRSSHGSAQGSGGNRFGRIGSSGGPASRGSAQSTSSSSSGAPPSNGALFTDGRLAPLAKMIGVEGKTFTTPRIDFLNLPSTQVPVVFALVLLIVTWLAGWRVFMLAVIVWFLYHAQNNAGGNGPSSQGSGRRAR